MPKLIHLPSTKRNQNTNLQHFVFVTKYRRPLMERQEIAQECERRIRHILTYYGLPVRALTVMSDHVHLFVDIGKNAPPDVAQVAKWFSSIHLRRLWPGLKRLPAFWGNHYFARSVGGDARAVRKYIEEQS